MPRQAARADCLLVISHQPIEGSVGSSGLVREDPIGLSDARGDGCPNGRREQRTALESVSKQAGRPGNLDLASRGSD